MPRNPVSSQAMAALLIIGLLATASAAGHIHSPSFFRRSLLAHPPAPAPTQSVPFRVTDTPATISGLQDAPPTGTTPVTVGHYLTNFGVMASIPWAAGSQTGGQKTHSSAGTTGTWGQELSYSAVDNGNSDVRPDLFEDSSALNGITLDSVKFGQKNNLWLMDTRQGNTLPRVSISCECCHATYPPGPCAGTLLRHM